MYSPTSFKRLVISVGFLFLASCLWTAKAATRQKTDVVYLKNGDRITCEIKKLEYGQLEVKAPYGKGSFTIDWAEIEKIDTPQHFVVEVESGTFFQGPIHTDAKRDDNLEVRTEQAIISLPQREIVHVGQYGERLLDRLKFAIDYGFTFARSNQQTQSTLQSNIEYRTEKVFTGAGIDSLFASQADAASTNRHEGSAFYYRRIQGSRWFGGAFGNSLTNDQQDLAHRISGGVGILRNLFTTNRNALLATAGIVYTNERFTVPEPDGASFNSMEGSFGVRYTTFRFDSTQFVFDFRAYPSLTQSGRVRTASDLSLYWKIIGDFYTRLGLYSNFDSSPPTNSAKHDYGVSTSFGWKF